MDTVFIAGIVMIVQLNQDLINPHWQKQKKWHSSPFFKKLSPFNTARPLSNGKGAVNITLDHLTEGPPELKPGLN